MRENPSGQLVADEWPADVNTARIGGKGLGANSMTSGLLEAFMLACPAYPGVSRHEALPDNRAFRADADRVHG